MRVATPYKKNQDVLLAYFNYNWYSSDGDHVCEVIISTLTDYDEPSKTIRSYLRQPNSPGSVLAKEIHDLSVINAFDRENGIEESF